ncbi:MAG: ABC transporter ATP-binding protein [Desulfovibrionaceae bacterium]|nr:ABC transporter ATP-binding protein [Desulfovibrionaceae bacterium]
MLTSNDPLLALSDLSVRFTLRGSTFSAVRSLSLTIPRSTIVGLVGESGCGKSLTARAILRLPPQNASLSGQILFHGANLLDVPEEAMRALRGRHISMIFQEPQTALNPVLTVGHQAQEVLEIHRPDTKNAMRERVLELFSQVGIPNADLRYASYPHELSGGMRQRVMIAMSLLGDPELLLADEPTTALDATMRQQILFLLLEQSAARGMSILCISHDLDLVRSFAETVAVMYAGRLVEQASVAELFSHPLHPYTKGLLAASPSALKPGVRRLTTIPGAVPQLTAMPKGCPFAPRCSLASDPCRKDFPPRCGDASHAVYCWNPL